jgi:recombination protein RecA
VTTAKEIAAEINKLLGARTVILGNDEALNVEYIPTGVLPIDHLLGGGIPRGRFTELFGAYSTLKSFVGLSTIAQEQAAGGVCALIDTEHSYDPEWAKGIGVDTESLIYQAPETGEEAIDVSEVLIRSGVSLIVWDSVAAMLPQTEGNKRLSKETVQPARLAALMSLGMRKLTACNDNTAIIFINQTRVNVGVMFGDPEVAAGGKALPYYASYRVALRKAGKVKDTIDGYDEEGRKAKLNLVSGVKIRATLEKSKLSAPSREALFTFDLNQGRIDETGYMIANGLNEGIIKHEGKSWWLEDENGMETERVVGLEKFRGWLEGNLEAQQRIKTALLPSSLGAQEPAKKKAGKQRSK